MPPRSNRPPTSAVGGQFRRRPRGGGGRPARPGAPRTTGRPLEPTDERLDFDVRHPAAPRGREHPVWWYPVRLADLDNEHVARDVPAAACWAARTGTPTSSRADRRPSGVGQPARVPAGVASAARSPRTTRAACCPGDCRTAMTSPATGRPPAPTTPGRGLPAQTDVRRRPRAWGRTAASTAETTRSWTRWRSWRRHRACAAARATRRCSTSAGTEVDADTAQLRLTAAMWLDETPDGEAARLHPLVALLLRRWLARRPEAWRGDAPGLRDALLRPAGRCHPAPPHARARVTLPQPAAADHGRRLPGRASSSARVHAGLAAGARPGRPPRPTG